MPAEPNSAKAGLGTSIVQALATQLDSKVIVTSGQSRHQRVGIQHTHVPVLVGQRQQPRARWWRWCFYSLRRRILLLLAGVGYGAFRCIRKTWFDRGRAGSVTGAGIMTSGSHIKRHFYPDDIPKA